MIVPEAMNKFTLITNPSFRFPLKVPTANCKILMVTSISYDAGSAQPVT